MKILFAIDARWVFALVLTAMVLGLSGCASTEPENLSERPWNAPNGYESGLPVQMLNQQRR